LTLKLTTVAILGGGPGDLHTEATFERGLSMKIHDAVAGPAIFILRRRPRVVSV
jgi:hypothetical protein